MKGERWTVYEVVDEISWDEIYVGDLRALEEKGYWIEVDGDKKVVRILLPIEVIE